MFALQKVDELPFYYIIENASVSGMLSNHENKI